MRRELESRVADGKVAVKTRNVMIQAASQADGTDGCSYSRNRDNANANDADQRSAVKV